MRRRGRTDNYGTVPDRGPVPPGPVRRWTARAAVLAGLVLVGAAVFASPAGANYARVDATVGCDRAVEWAASASTEGDADERSNPRVLVDWRPADSDDDAWEPAGPPGRFDEANSHRFTGRFELPDGVDEIDLRVQPDAPWGDGAEAGSPRFSRAAVPAVCDDVAVAVRIDADCSSGTASVDLRSVDDDTWDVTVAVDRVAVRDLEVDGAGTDLVVPVLSGRSTALRVTADDLVLAERTVGADCDPNGPMAVVLERCGPGDAVVQASAPAEAELRVRAEGTIVATAPLGSAPVQRTLELPSSQVAVEVEIDGEAAAAGPVGGCDGPVAGLTACGGDRAPCGVERDETALDPGPPPPPPPSQQIELDPDDGLARTGPWERAVALALGGLLLAGGGLAVTGRHRRTVTPGVLESVLEPHVRHRRR